MEEKKEENDDEAEGSKKDINQEYDGEDETQGTTGEVPDFTDSFHPQESNLASVQESSSQSLTTKALDEPGEGGRRVYKGVGREA